ncbi:MAG: chemotaxis protein CheA [Spirochaetaceae bacterium]|jgi:two-component system chemotaxis sensor kinase CheA|nr:chemotaxis protein CheA [Spirochaetaceae bacterium]
MSDYLDPNNEELLKDFFSEAQMQVETLEQNILILENESGNRDAVDEIFRAAHTLKGGAATVEMMELSHFTHLVEDVLDAIRSDQVSVNEDVVDVLLSAIDVVKAMLEKRMEGAVYQEDTKEIEGKLSHLLPEAGKKGGAKAVPAKAAAPAKAAPAPAAPASSPAAVPTSSAPKAAGGAASLSVMPVDDIMENEIQELLESTAGTPVFRVSVRFDESSLMNTVGGIQVYAALKSKGSILKTTPDFDALYGDTFYPVVDYYIASTEDAANLHKYVILPDVSLDASVTNLQTLLPAEAAAPEQAASGAGAGSEGAAAEGAKAPAAEAAAQQAAKGAGASADAKKAGKEAGSILRVDSKRIDDLLNLVSETVITKATFNQITFQFNDLMMEFHTLAARFRERIKNLFDKIPEYVEASGGMTSAKDIRKAITEEFADMFTIYDSYETLFKNSMVKFRSTSQNLGRITGELQEGVMRIRMVPISQIFSRFPRLVRDLSKTLSKKINLLIEGEETELDKSVIEDLLDPIMHSVRNSIDHGIESPADRAAAGKSEEGTVILKAANEGNMIVIEICDDGKGIDVEAVKAKAVERGLIHPNKLITDVEAFNLIFEPGFSTAKTITSISGRGVGLDVVRRQIEKLNGTVTVQSEKGKGTKFIIKLPLTLSIIQGLLVRVGTEIYSIPITSVIESVRIKPSEIKMIDNNEVFNIRNDVLSLLRLDRLFGIQTQRKNDYNFIVIVGTAEKKMGFMVDSLIGEEDVVIKPLRDQYTNSPGIAGASILGDGSVSLIIDVGQLLELGLHKEMENRKFREFAAGRE